MRFVFGQSLKLKQVIGYGMLVTKIVGFEVWVEKIPLIKGSMAYLTSNCKILTT